MDKKQKEIGALEKAAEDFILILWTLTTRRGERRGTFRDIVYVKSGETKTPPKVKAILDILRLGLNGENIGAELIEKLERIINEKTKITLIEIGSYIVLKKNGSAERTLAESMLAYLFIKALNHRNIDVENSGFIGICPKCNGIFLKRRIDQKYCDQKCKLDSWNARKNV